MPIHRLALVFLVVAAAVFFACTSGEELPRDAAAIGPAGGVITHGSVTLEIPPGALESEQTITIRETDDAPPADTEPLTKVYAFEPEGLVFKLPVRARFAVGESTDGEIFWSDPVTSSLEPLESAIESNAVVATTTHFSRACAAKHRCRPNAACTLGPSCRRPLSTCIARECACSSGHYACSVVHGSCTDAGNPDAQTDTGTDAHTNVDADAGAADAHDGSTTPICPRGAGAPPVVPPGTPVLLAPTPEPRFLAIDDECVYWTDYDTQSLNAVSVDGGPVVTLATTAFRPTNVATDATNVYWTAGANVLSTPKRGGPTTTLFAGTGSFCLGLHVYAGDVYWTCSPGVVGKAPAGGGPATILATGQSSADGIAVVGGSIVWTTQNVGNVYRMPLAGGPIATITLGWGNVSFGLGVIGDEAIWTSSSGTVGAWNATTGAVRTLVQTSGNATTISTDGEAFVYWTHPPNFGETLNEIRRAPIAGGSFTTVVASANKPFAVAPRGTTLFWTHRTGVSRLNME